MEFSRQLSNLPAPWFLENMLLPLARKISPSLRMGTLEDPFFFSPIITASQVSRRGPVGGEHCSACQSCLLVTTQVSRGLQVVGGCFSQPVLRILCLFLSSITQLSAKLSPITTASQRRRMQQVSDKPVCHRHAPSCQHMEGGGSGLGLPSARPAP